MQKKTKIIIYKSQLNFINGIQKYIIFKKVFADRKGSKNMGIGPQKKSGTGREHLFYNFSGEGFHSQP
jgi:hypothetical protein